METGPFGFRRVDGQAELKKDEGNTAFKEKRYSEALACYSEAIVLDTKNQVYFSNRSACHAALNDLKSAVDDAEECLRLDDTYAKGYFRLANAQLGLNLPAAAESTARKGLEQEKDNQGLVKLVHKCRRAKKELKEQDRVEKLQLEMRKKCEGMSPEEFKYKAWCAARVSILCSAAVAARIFTHCRCIFVIVTVVAGTW
jgi:tetratricopeptide (TPR) repeat protein